MKRKDHLTEAALIERWFARPAGRRGDVLLPIGDDAAVLRIPRGRDLVVATDVLCEGTHFPAGTPARAVGHRALAVNLSDLAAMGATPLWATLNLCIPAAEPHWLREFSRGFFALARRAGIALVGGDTVRGPLAAGVTVHGCVRPGRYVTRAGARPGDEVFVTGRPGDAFAGRMALAAPRNRRRAASLIRSFLYPVPRLAEGASLVGIASSMIDVSDGLDDDLARLLRASGCGAALDLRLLPVSAAARRFRGEAEALAGTLTGGDDYELLFTVPPRRRAALLKAVQGWRCPVTRIGRVTAGRRPVWRVDGRQIAVPDNTFRHF